MIVDFPLPEAPSKISVTGWARFFNEREVTIPIPVLVATQSSSPYSLVMRVLTASSRVCKFSDLGVCATCTVPAKE